jgi:hypothetical protein
MQGNLDHGNQSAVNASSLMPLRAGVSGGPCTFTKLVRSCRALLGRADESGVGSYRTGSQGDRCDGES